MAFPCAFGAMMHAWSHHASHYWRVKRPRLRWTLMSGWGILMPLCFLFAVLGDVQALLAIARWSESGSFLCYFRWCLLNFWPYRFITGSKWWIQLQKCGIPGLQNVPRSFLSFFSEARTTEAAKVTKSCNVSTSRFRFENLYLRANVSLHTNVLKIVTSRGNI